jgi:hypothetical protein
MAMQRGNAVCVIFVALGGHFATFHFISLIFMKHFFFIINFQKENANTFTLLSFNHSYSEKCSKRAT